MAANPHTTDVLTFWLRDPAIKDLLRCANHPNASAEEKNKAWQSLGDHIRPIIEYCHAKTGLDCAADLFPTQNPEHPALVVLAVKSTCQESMLEAFSTEIEETVLRANLAHPWQNRVRPASSQPPRREGR